MKIDIPGESHLVIRMSELVETSLPEHARAKLDELVKRGVDRADVFMIRKTFDFFVAKEVARPAEDKRVSDLLRSITDEEILENHPIADFASAMENFERRARKLIAAGGDSVVIQLSDGNVLKLTQYPLTTEMGNRPFDLPMLDRGSNLEGNRAVHYFVQPWAQTVVDDNGDLSELLYEQNYALVDPNYGNGGLWQGKLYLLDPFSAVKAPFRLPKW